MTPATDWGCDDEYADDTTIIGFISDNDESSYCQEVTRATTCCESNDLILNISKTKELVIDFRKSPNHKDLISW